MCFYYICPVPIELRCQRYVKDRISIYAVLTGGNVTRVKALDICSGCHLEFIQLPSSAFHMRHTSVYLSGILNISNNVYAGGVPQLILNGIDHPTAVRSRVVRRQVATKKVTPRYSPRRSCRLHLVQEYGPL